jgi:hypothetical protein
MQRASQQDEQRNWRRVHEQGLACLSTLHPIVLSVGATSASSRSRKGQKQAKAIESKQNLKFLSTNQKVLSTIHSQPGGHPSYKFIRWKRETQIYGHAATAGLRSARRR